MYVSVSVCLFTCAQVGVDTITQRIQHMEFDLSVIDDEENPVCLRFVCPQDATAQAATLQAQLEVLRAARIEARGPHTRIDAHVKGWPAKLANKAVRGLPKWAKAVRS